MSLRNATAPITTTSDKDRVMMYRQQPTSNPVAVSSASMDIPQRRNDDDYDNEDFYNIGGSDQTMGGEQNFVKLHMNVGSHFSPSNYLWYNDPSNSVSESLNDDEETSKR
eukprot:TRINITY_DN4892_c0_g1_i1.p1 TRINITY_DN4892_c0_g1~~TRINITY_DN4892_c0_g1_i1.p1  ORF type:complete len:110 (+),score=27.51 TRINITY_DN4892_c0_g1_i1:68-397(+)